jgi:drug/metabolite transporter (DMT)-like permease
VIARGLESIVPPVAFSFWRWTVATAVILPFAFKELRRDRLGRGNADNLRCIIPE